MEVKYTYPSTYLADIMELLRARGFKLDKDSASGGFHPTVHGSRLQIVDSLGQKYEILMNPIFEKKEEKT